MHRITRYGTLRPPRHAASVTRASDAHPPRASASRSPPRCSGEERTLFVSLPDSYARGHGRYPVLYLTDAEAQFAHARSTVQVPGTRNGRDPRDDRRRRREHGPHARPDAVPRGHHGGRPHDARADERRRGSLPRLLRAGARPVDRGDVPHGAVPRLRGLLRRRALRPPRPAGAPGALPGRPRRRAPGSSGTRERSSRSSGRSSRATP